MLRKFIAIFMILPLTVLCLPFLHLETFASSKPLLADCIIGELDYTSAYYTDSGVVTEKYTWDGHVNTSFENGDDITIHYEFRDANANVSFICLAFMFPSTDYIYGQEYNLSFTTNITVSARTYLYSYFFDYNPTTVILAGCNTIDECKNIGDSNVYPGQFDGYFRNKLKAVNNGIMPTNMFDYKGRFTDTNGFSQNISIPVSGLSSTEEPILRFYFLVQNDNFAQFGNHFMLNNVSLTPVGTTKYMYADKEYQQNVQSALDNIQSGLFDEGETVAPVDPSVNVDDYLEVESEYNKDFSSDLENQFSNAGNVFENNGAFAFISQTFNYMLLTNSSINSLIIFSLAIGLCVLILGRRLNA